MSLTAHACSGGHVRHLERLVYRNGDMKLRELSAMFGIIEHPREGLILYDTGFSHDLSSRLRGVGRLYPMVVPYQVSAEQAAHAHLRRLAYRPEDVRHVIISHMHADHVGGLTSFPGAQIHCDRTALHHLRTNRRLKLARHGYFAELVPQGLDASIHQISPIQQRHNLLSNTVDLFGDGSLQLVPLDGHAPGQLGLLLDLNGRRVMFVADACFCVDSIEQNVGPSNALARAIYHDAKTAERTLARLHSLHINDPEIVFIPTHCWRCARGNLTNWRTGDPTAQPTDGRSTT
jgi:glyoxylase-like metal-dependent hydrolase (beta-lactamase superfamily II)